MLIDGLVLQIIISSCTRSKERKKTFHPVLIVSFSTSLNMDLGERSLQVNLKIIRVAQIEKIERKIPASYWRLSFL